jgi:hypothetical protein
MKAFMRRALTFKESLHCLPSTPAGLLHQDLLQQRQKMCFRHQADRCQAEAIGIEKHAQRNHCGPFVTIGKRMIA